MDAFISTGLQLGWLEFNPTNIKSSRWVTKTGISASSSTNPTPLLLSTSPLGAAPLRVAPEPTPMDVAAPLLVAPCVEVDIEVEDDPMDVDEEGIPNAVRALAPLTIDPFLPQWITYNKIMLREWLKNVRGIIWKTIDPDTNAVFQNPNYNNKEEAADKTGAIRANQH